MEWFGWMSSVEGWVALVTLVGLEIVLGVDNIIFISILVGRLPPEQRNLGRRLGLGFAMLTRIMLLLSITWVMQLTTPLLTVMGRPITGRDLILIGGGLFLLWKSVHEIHESMTPGEEEDGDGVAAKARASFAAIIAQIAVIDIVFSLDSVITAVGMTDVLAVMIGAVVLSTFVMAGAATPLSAFIDRHPTVKMLALSFLVVVGVVLVAEGFDHHVPKGYVYFAMAFSLAVELLNIRVRARAARPVTLHASGRAPK